MSVSLGSEEASSPKTLIGKDRRKRLMKTKVSEKEKPRKTSIFRK
jgi:hypothetical protein